jgi:hypothetical protein
MTRDPRKVWRYYAQALVQEEDPAKISALATRLLEALTESKEQPKLNPPRSKNTRSE